MLLGRVTGDCNATPEMAVEAVKHVDGPFLIDFDETQVCPSEWGSRGPSAMSMSCSWTSVRRRRSTGQLPRDIPSPPRQETETARPPTQRRRKKKENVYEARGGSRDSGRHVVS